MVLTGLIVACALASLLFLGFAVQAFHRVRIVKMGVHLVLSGFFVMAAVAVFFVGASLFTYQRLTHEQNVLEVQFQRLGERHFRAKLTYPNGAMQDFELKGDEWQVDARVLKWRGLANVLGFDTVYRIERLGGRYADIAKERSEERTVHSLVPPDRFDLWAFAREVRDWAPWIDALYGSATYLPMADGALYQVSISQSGVLARPLNQAAKQAVGGWR
ncbi:cation/multidrug efflux pump [Usitatibacter palustris]|uniref:Cation/multidrug efflux pump n=1 Tax=Usitatibacter palustris TaxID=2732487 RepID=A0A6M4H6A0_9PROT|nr:cation/multidrug efflux pump [Usitatibacter palustris]QJR13994.1 hypothetical protein DSM104440_00786 [Usitatibacter palustris]